MRSKKSELMQNLFPVGFGPSSKTCPRCPPHFLQRTSILCMPWFVSFFNSTFPSAAKKLGQPQAESNFVSEEKRAAPHAAQIYFPLPLLYKYFPVKGSSVPFSSSYKRKALKIL